MGGRIRPVSSTSITIAQVKDAFLLRRHFRQLCSGLQKIFSCLRARFFGSPVPTTYFKLQQYKSFYFYLMAIFSLLSFILIQSFLILSIFFLYNCSFQEFFVLFLGTLCLQNRVGAYEWRSHALLLSRTLCQSYKGDRGGELQLM